MGDEPRSGPVLRRPQQSAQRLLVYPRNGAVSEDTPVDAVPPLLQTALVAEQQAERFARAGGRGVVLRLGLLDGPGTTPGSTSSSDRSSQAQTRGPNTSSFPTR